MNQPRILGYMKDPSLLANAPVKELEYLVDEFPYCSVTRLLYTKALFDQKSIRYHEQLKKTAAHIPDRSILYWLINDGAIEQPAFDLPGITASTIAQSAISEKSSPQYPPSLTVEQSKDPFESLILRLNKLSGVSFPWLEKADQKLRDLIREHEQRLGSIVQEYMEKRVQAQIVQTTRDDVDEVAKPIEEIKPATEIYEQINISPEESETIEPDVIAPAEPSKIDLIERFISEAPSMPRPKKEFYSPVNMAHKSTIDSEDLVSETLAEVHLKQGNIPKALKIYERLCLIIPEKSAYFAARIEKIKKENNLL
jgi:hypothetical protein